MWQKGRCRSSLELAERAKGQSKKIEAAKANVDD
jgi:hypothetical protein